MHLQAGQGAGKGVLANRIIGGITAGTGGDLRHPLGHIFGFVVDHMIIAVACRQRAFLRPAGGADGCRAKRFHPLPGQQPDPASGRMEQDGLAGIDGKASRHQIGDGQPFQHDGGTGLERDRVGKPDNEAGIDGAVRRIGAVAKRIGNAVTGGKMGDTLANSGDDAGPFTAKDQIRLDRPGIDACPHIDIDEIDADGPMLDHHLAGCRRHLAKLDPMNDIRATNLLRRHCISHGCLLQTS